MLTRWRDIENQAFSNLLESLWGLESGGGSSPAVNVCETGDSYRIEVAAPGFKKEDFNVNIENNVLTISSDKEESRENKDEQYRRKEFSFSSFRRSFVLPDTAESDRIGAKYENGILSISIPKKEIAIKKQARQIPISETGQPSNQNISVNS